MRRRRQVVEFSLAFNCKGLRWTFASFLSFFNRLLFISAKPLQDQEDTIDGLYQGMREINPSWAPVILFWKTFANSTPSIQHILWFYVNQVHVLNMDLKNQNIQSLDARWIDGQLNYAAVYQKAPLKIPEAIYLSIQISLLRTPLLSTMPAQEDHRTTLVQLWHR